eukprot:m.357693 g.357693  ORF g.357693 m.357693 type:complete len:70 (+) comp17900_c0_seq1:745-954(+)
MDKWITCTEETSIYTQDSCCSWFVHEMQMRVLCSEQSRDQCVLVSTGKTQPVTTHVRIEVLQFRPHLFG